ncbi:MAG: hypothetical protein AAF799_04015 [Myxococcota bacterium]
MIPSIPPRTRVIGSATFALLAGCAFDSELADRAAAQVVIDSTSVLTSHNDMGYRIALTRCRVAIDTLEFTTDGEMHASRFGPAWDLLVPSAFAHPGHAAGGEVVGELPGRHIFDWRDGGAWLGEATLLKATYNGANFSFTRAEVHDGLAPDDPLIGHTFEIMGVATVDDERWEFSALIDQDAGRRVVGLPMELDLDPSEDPELELGLQLMVEDFSEGTTLFDGIDFAMLDQDGDHVVVIEPGTEAHDRLARSTQGHGHYGVLVHE